MEQYEMGSFITDLFIAMTLVVLASAVTFYSVAHAETNEVRSNTDICGYYDWESQRWVTVEQ